MFFLMVLLSNRYKYLISTYLCRILVAAASEKGVDFVGKHGSQGDSEKGQNYTIYKHSYEFQDNCVEMFRQ